MEQVSANRSFGGEQGVCKHDSIATGTEMTFSVYGPPHAAGEKPPVVWYLSGLTCTHANVTEKGEFRRTCAKLALIFVAPDTSPRGDSVPEEDGAAYDFGLGAGFYVDATQEPFARNYRMWMQPGYDHSYYFIFAFMADHLEWHAERLGSARR